VNHADIAQHVTAVNRAFESPAVTQFWNPLTAAGRAALDAMITQQAADHCLHRRLQAVDDRDARRDPLLIVFKQAPRRGGEDHTLVVE